MISFPSGKPFLPTMSARFSPFKWGCAVSEKPGQSYSFNLYNVVSPKITNEMIVGFTNLDQVVDKDEDVPSATTTAISSASRWAIFIRSARRAGR